MANYFTEEKIAEFKQTFLDLNLNHETMTIQELRDVMRAEGIRQILPSRGYLEHLIDEITNGEWMGTVKGAYPRRGDPRAVD